MPVLMNAKNAGLSEKEVDELQRRLGRQLPVEYRQFLVRGNVFVPDSNRITGQGMIGSVVKFLGVSLDPTEDLHATMETYVDRVPVNAIPVALAGGGNLVCIDLVTGATYLWDHENEAVEGEEPDFRNMHLLAESFSRFVDAMEPFDPSTVVLDPKDVVSVKLKPGFAEKFKDFRR